MYRDGEEAALARAVAAHEALEEIGVVEVPVPTAGPSARELTAFAERLEHQLAERRAAVHRCTGPEGPIRVRELWPWWSYVVHTSVAAPVALANLAALVGSGGPFNGFVKDGRMNGMRRSSYSPRWVTATVASKPYGAVVHVRLGVAQLAAACMAAALGFIPLAVALLTVGEDGLILLVMALFVVGFSGALPFEARKTHALLLRALPPVSSDAKGRLAPACAVPAALPRYSQRQ